METTEERAAKEAGMAAGVRLAVRAVAVTVTPVTETAW